MEENTEEARRGLLGRQARFQDLSGVQAVALGEMSPPDHLGV